MRIVESILILTTLEDSQSYGSVHEWFPIEFKRVKLRAGVLGSPVQAAVSSSSTSSAVVRTSPFMPSCSSTAPFMQHRANKQVFN